MPLGVVDSNDFESELVHLGIVKPDDNDKSEDGKVIDIERGRGEKKETPEVIRNLVAECALQGEPHKSIMNAFGVSQASVSAYKNGAHSTANYNEGNDKLQQHVKTVRARITKKASNRMMLALNGITPEKLVDAKARDLAAIAKDMSAVIKNIDPPRDDSNVNNGVQFVIMAPPLREESDFRTIHVNE